MLDRRGVQAGGEKVTPRGWKSNGVSIVLILSFFMGIVDISCVHMGSLTVSNSLGTTETHLTGFGRTFMWQLMSIMFRAVIETYAGLIV